MSLPAPSAEPSEPQRDLASPLGNVLSQGVHGSLFEHDVLPTANGTWLAVAFPPDWDRKADGRAISLSCAAAVTHDPDNNGENHNGLMLTVAFSDAAGQLWQTAERVSTLVLWDQLFSTASCYAKQSPEKRPEHLLARTERTLTAKLSGVFDDRNRRTLQLVRDDPTVRDGFVRLVFPIKEKYFGYSMTLKEVCATYRGRQPEARPTRIASLVLAIDLHTDAESVATLDSADRPLPAKPVALAEVTPVRGESIVLSPTWRNRLGPARQADLQAWRAALRAAGAEEAEIAAILRPNPYLLVRGELGKQAPVGAP